LCLAAQALCLAAQVLCLAARALCLAARALCLVARALCLTAQALCLAAQALCLIGIKERVLRDADNGRPRLKVAQGGADRRSHLTPPPIPNPPWRVGSGGRPWQML